MTDSPRTKEHYQKLKNLTVLKLQQLKHVRAGRRLEIEKIENFLIDKNPPQQFGGSEGLEVSIRKEFEEICLIIQQYTNGDPKKLTVLEFYNTLEFIKKKAQPAKSKA